MYITSLSAHKKLGGITLLYRGENRFGKVRRFAQDNSMKEGQLGQSPSSLSSLSPEPCVSKGRGWVCRGVGKTVPGYVLSVLHVGLGDKLLFLPAPSYGLTLLTRTHSC